jgi:hypothetical protein
MISSRMSAFIGIGLIVITVCWLAQIPPVAAARIQWCMRVVPSGEIVTRYGSNWCK